MRTIERKPGMIAVIALTVMLASGVSHAAPARRAPSPLTGMAGDLEDYGRVAGLAFTVEDAGWPTLSMLGHAQSVLGALRGSEARAGHLTPVPVSLGCISLGTGGRLTEQQINEVSNTMTFAGEGGAKLKLTVTRLSPAVLLQSDAARVELFAPEQKTVHDTPAGTVPPAPGAVKPLRWATPGPDGQVLTGVLGSQPLQELPFQLWENRFERAESQAADRIGTPPVGSGQPWLLLWYGSDSPLVSPGGLRALVSGPYYPRFTANQLSVRQVDAPILLVFENAPKSVSLEKADDAQRLLISFDGRQMGKAAILPLYGHVLPPSAETEPWLADFPEAVKARCDGWAARLGRLTVDVKETVARDAETGRVTFTEEFDYVTLRADAEFFAPVPAMLALAFQQGLPVEFSAAPVDAQLPTQFGPTMFVPGKRYSWSLDGLGRAVSDRQIVGPADPRAAELARELAAEVDKVLTAGHLVPMIQVRQAPYLPQWGTVYWKDPSETLYLLAEVLPLLPAGAQAKLRGYLKKEYETYRPDKVVRLSMRDGERREWCDMPGSVIRYYTRHLGGSPYSAEFLETEPSLYRAYGVARYCDATGEKPTAEVLDFWRDAMRESLRGRQWDTLGWFRGKYARKRGQNADRLPWRLRYYQHTLRCAHRDMAGIIGYLRLCRMSGRSVEQDAWGQLARLTALRFALARYGRYVAASGLFKMPENPEAAAGLQESADYSKPENHAEQVLHVDQFCVTLPFGGAKAYGVFSSSWGRQLHYYPTFVDMAPEVGRLMADLGLVEDARRYLSHFEQMQGNWFMAFADNNPVGTEQALMTAYDSHSMFMAHAWIAGTPPEELERYIHVPWAARGDLFYMHKLGETIKAYRGVKWSDGEP